MEEYLTHNIKFILKLTPSCRFLHSVIIVVALHYVVFSFGKLPKTRDVFGFEKFLMLFVGLCHAIWFSLLKNNRKHVISLCLKKLNATCRTASLNVISIKSAVLNVFRDNLHKTQRFCKLSDILH